MSGRVYAISFSQVVVSAAQDLVAIYGNGMAFEVLEVWLSQTTATATSGIPVNLKTYTSTVTQGSGGTVVSAQKTVPGDASPTVICHVNDTTAASTTGSVYQVRQDAWNVIDPYLWNPPSPKDAPVVPPTGAFVVSMPTALTNPQTIQMSGGVLIRELF